ncbi:heavy-metal-associated domain-containing protein [Thermodesulfobacteriota bacterium]
MDKKTFHIPNISCGHCVNNIKNELGELEGIAKVEGNPDTKEITVEWESPASLEAIKDMFIEINYPSED